MVDVRESVQEKTDRASVIASVIQGTKLAVWPIKALFSIPGLVVIFFIVNTLYFLTLLYEKRYQIIGADPMQDERIASISNKTDLVYNAIMRIENRFSDPGGRIDLFEVEANVTECLTHARRALKSSGFSDLEQTGNLLRADASLGRADYLGAVYCSAGEVVVFMSGMEGGISGELASRIGFSIRNQQSLSSMPATDAVRHEVSPLVVPEVP